MHRISILAVLLFARAVSFAQDYTFKHLANSDGLPSELRLSMAEDKLGRLWISSDEGISVFDGYEINNIAKEEGNGLITNFIDQIFCDKRGAIWIASANAIQYKKEKEKVFIEVTYGDSSIKSALLCGETTAGAILVCANKKAYLVDTAGRVSLLSSLTNILKTSRGPLAACHLKSDQWLFCVAEKIVLADIKKQKLIKDFEYWDGWGICKVNDSSFIAGSYVNDSVVLVNTNTGLITNICNWKSNNGQPIKGYLRDICAIGNNRYAFSSRYYGLYIIDTKDSSFQNIVNDPSDAFSLKSNFLSSIFCTKDGTLFINAPGLSYTPVNPNQFNAATIFTNEKGERVRGVINSFTQDAEKNIWVGTNKQLIKWNRKTGISKYYYYTYEGGGIQKTRTVRTVITDSKDRIWAAGFGSGFGMLKPDGTFKVFMERENDKKNSLPGNEIFSFTKTKNNLFLISSNGGFCFFDPLLEKFETFFDHPKLRSIAGLLTFHSIIDKDDNMWIANRTGLYCYHKKKDSLIKIKLPEKALTKFIFTIAQDSSGNTFAAGREGVYLIPTRSYAVERSITKNDGLQGDYILGLLCDKDNNIWISGNRGLARYNTAKQTIETFTAEDGVLQGNHKITAYYRSPENEIFIGGEDGFNYFFPETISSKKYPIKIFNTGLELPDSLIVISGSADIALPYWYNTLAINYLAVDFNLPGFIQYRYKLYGFDTGYIYAGRQRQARYTNLPAGKYSFIAEASINGKDWYATKQPLAFTIAQVFWKTDWFIFLLACLSALAVYRIYRFRIKRIRSEESLRSDYEIKLNELENSALRTQMNPHFIFNSLNTINAFVSSNDRHQAHQYISKFSKLVRLTLDHSRQKRITLNEEVQIVHLYIQLEKIRFDNCFDYEIDITNLDTESIEVPPMIIQPFVENAILHGLLPKKKEGYIKIKIYNSGSNIICIVEDNGIGRMAASKIKSASLFQRKSHGMDITVKRIELFNKEHRQTLPLKIIDLYNQKNEPAGTRVEITLAYE